MSIAIMILSAGLFVTGVYGYISSHELIKTRTQIVTVYTSEDNRITKVFKDGTWDESLEWLQKD